MLTTSDDNTAELLLKEIGLAPSGAGTRPAGRPAVARHARLVGRADRRGSRSPTGPVSTADEPC